MGTGEDEIIGTEVGAMLGEADIDRRIEQLIAECERNGIDSAPLIAETLLCITPRGVGNTAQVDISSLGLL